MATQKVQVFAIGTSKAGTPKDKRRYYVRWRVDGRDRTRAFKTKVEAERLRSEVQQAMLSGAQFDTATGLPFSKVKSEKTWFSWSREWLGLKWPGWSGNSRRSSVESLVAITPHMTGPRASKRPADLQSWLRNVGYAMAGEDLPRDENAEWLERNSVPLAELTPAVLESALTAATTKRDGHVASAEVVRRRRNALNSALKVAVRREHLDANPMEKIEWKVPDRTLAVDISTVPSFRDVVEIVAFTRSTPTAAARYAALFGCVGMAGMRPSEAMGLRIEDIELPAAGWGSAILRGATTSPGTRYTAGGGVHEDKALKQRAVGAVRIAPLPPALVAILHSHLLEFGQADGRVFTTSTGRVMTSTSYSEPWKRARANQWPPSSVLAGSTLYDLRHSAATLMLRAGVAPAEVARRLGHSVDVLMRTYAGVMDDERDRSNAIIEAEQANQLGASVALGSARRGDRLPTRP